MDTALPIGQVYIRFGNKTRRQKTSVKFYTQKRNLEDAEPSG